MVADWDSIFIGRGVEGAVITAGGWGPLFGNEGSLQSLIREGLRAAAQHHDGRGPQTPLTKAFCSALNLQDFSDSAFAIYQHGISAEQLFPLACIMQQTAEAGDEVTLRLFEQSAYELVDGVRAVISRLDLETPVLLSCQGSLFQTGDVLMSALRRNLAEFLPEVRLVEPLMSALGGAYRLGRKHLGEDLSREEIESLATQFAETDPQVEGFV